MKILFLIGTTLVYSLLFEVNAQSSCSGYYRNGQYITNCPSNGSGGEAFRVYDASY